MFERTGIALFGRQPFAKVNNQTLKRIIRREFGSRASEVKQKLKIETGETQKVNNRIAAAIIKLADKDVNAIDDFTNINNNDFRDILMKAEYPRCVDLGFGEIKNGTKMKQIYLADWNDYSNWLNKK
jgi:hypothetical protein